ncbi:MAG: DUF3786 domain-containing protein [Myxococcales bacterium]|nr:MAG: DUF3786 domain-containing protein [Myxococcales bacterium]
MTYKVVEIYKDLPRTNCKDCSRAGCFQFAAAVHLGEVDFGQCPHLEEARRREMTARLEAEREKGDGTKPSSSEQALVALCQEMARADLSTLAGKSGAEHIPGPPETLRLSLFGVPHFIYRNDVRAVDGRESDILVKILLMLYATWANGAPVTGEWVAFKQLPNAIGKAKSFEKHIARLARHFEGRMDNLKAVAASLGGRAISTESADAAFEFQALPALALRLLYWEGDDDFPARASLLMDATIPNYLDQEGTVFLAETLVNLLLQADEAEG